MLITSKVFRVSHRHNTTSNFENGGWGKIGYIVELDKENKDELHDKHADFPIISNKQPIDPLELSDYQTNEKALSKIQQLRCTN